MFNIISSQFKEDYGPQARNMSETDLRSRMPTDNSLSACNRSHGCRHVMMLHTNKYSSIAISALANVVTTGAEIIMPIKFYPGVCMPRGYFESYRKWMFYISPGPDF
jgi:hypothetical protein